MTKIIKLSPSAISSFRACGGRYFLGYEERITTVEDKEILRFGSGWHDMQEYRYTVPDCTIEVMSAYLDERYANCPQSISIEKWEVEKYTLLAAFIAYCEHFQEKEDIISSEQRFELMLRHPQTHVPIRDGKLVGRVDKFKRDGNRVKVKEYKTTGRDISTGSDYWRELEQNIQPRSYVYALHRMIEKGEIDLGAMVGSVEYDVFRRPGIKPKASVKKELVVSGAPAGKYIYYGMTFAISNGEIPNIETPPMFFARLLADMKDRPNFYFARREIAIPTKELEDFEQELFNLYRLIKFCRENKAWDFDKSACSSPFHCTYKDICLNNVDITENLPPNFTRRK